MKRIISLGKDPPVFRSGYYLFLMAIFLSCISQVNGQCEEWDLRGKWSMEQSDGYRVQMTLQQDGSALFGTAKYPRGDISFVHGTVSGSIVGEDFTVEIEWEKGGIGVYKASSFSCPGRINRRLDC